jgi:hypothetical protein
MTFGPVAEQEEGGLYAAAAAEQVRGVLLVRAAVEGEGDIR